MTMEGEMNVFPDPSVVEERIQLHQKETGPGQ